jgi:mono/diheme cytochrome c family protein
MENPDKPMRLLLLSLIGAFTPLLQAEDFSEADKLFTLKVGPLLSEKCNGCHGDDAEKIKGGLNMLTRGSLLKGGDEFGGEVLVPGDVEKSFLVETIKWSDPDWEMPPKENDRLTEEQIKDVEAWIEAGAPWPEESVQLAIREAEAKKEVTEEGVIVKTSGGLGDDWTFRRYRPEDIWAFQKVKKPEVPKIEKTGFSGRSNPVGHHPVGHHPVGHHPVGYHPVDAFILAKLNAAGYEPAPEADPLTLLRRATLDLTGLPPTPKEIAAFRSAWSVDSDKAWTGLIDRLLASPHYGERWAQHWLDVARYADTGGMSNDYERSNAWRYRDYVIRAFNEDKPYNEFVVEQLAGDELADNSLRRRKAGDYEAYVKARKNGDYTPEEGEKIIATGFLRMGPWDPAMVKNEEARQLYLDDVVNAVGQTFLSTTMRCFKCHDHKFDPLPTKDYYRMYSAFAGTQMAERPVPFLPEENLDGFAESEERTQRLFDYARSKKEALQEKREKAAKAWYKENGLEYVEHADRKDLPDEMKPPRHVGLSVEEQGRLKVREQDDWIWERRKDRYEPLAQTVYNGPDPKFLNARKLRMPDNPNINWKPDSHILTGGALEAKGDRVTPGVLSALGVPVDGAHDDDPYQLPESIEGRRLALAKWIAHPENPLTARSFVNRVWQQHFGQAIAGNPNNFGVKGKKPTHPELLDWLAADFVENGWTLKRLHRLIMTSDAYRQASHHPGREYLASDDPENALLAYFPTRRLTAEELRDSLLAITGELSTDAGGLPIMPEINMEVALQPRMIQFSLAPAYQPDPTPERRNRRTIYAYRVRGMADPFLELFNQPNPSDSCEMRDSAAVSPQAFTLLNSDQITDRSIAFAKRLQEQGGDRQEQISNAFQRALGRAPDSVELARLTKYVDEMHEYHKGIEPERPDYPTEITRSLVEEFSGDTFEYQEILPAFEDYEPDLKAADVDAETRALADLGILLFNTNEFVYVY